MTSGSASPPAALGERILVLAPVGRDAPLLCQVLGQAGLAAVACGDMNELTGAMRGGAGAVLLTEEALAPAAVSDLVAALAAEPPWSDLPMVLLAGGELLGPNETHAVTALRSVANVTVLERPTRGAFLVTALQAALRARRRQYEIRDLVERERSAREDAEAAWKEADAASRLKDEFLATVSHELRTPLGAILLWSRLLLSGRLSAQKTHSALEGIERSAVAQSQLVEDLLDVSRMTAGKLRLNLQQTDLANLVEGAIEVIFPAAEAKRVRIEATLDPRPGQARVDAERIQQVIWNLLSNAVKFTPSGGQVSARLWRDSSHVHFEVTDTGQGIAPSFLPHVFERFRQGDATMRRRHGGLGLGLAISRQIVELHGGVIHANSPGEGKGAVFRVDLPAELANWTTALQAPLARNSD